MKSQRELYVTPIVKMDPTYYFQISTDSIVLIDSTRLLGQMFNFDLSNSKKINILNVGNGTAVDIVTEWVYDYDWIKAFCEENKISKNMINIEIIDDQSLFKYKSGTYSLPLAKNEKMGHLGALSQNNDIIELSVPRWLIMAKIILIKSDWLTNGVTEDNNYRIISSKHTIKLRYQTIYKESLNSTFEIEVGIRPSSSGSYKEEEKMIYHCSQNEFGVIVNIKEI
jgi:hypothetical protein